MRHRGATATDIMLLIVALDAGVQPRNRCPVSGGFHGPGALVSLGRRRRATGRPEKYILHAPRKKNGQK